MSAGISNASGFCSIHGMSAGQCFDLHQAPRPEPTPTTTVVVTSETVTQRHVRLQQLHATQGWCPKCLAWCLIAMARGGIGPA